MKTLFESTRVEEVKQRLDKLEPTSGRQWGKMTPAQMLAHCSAAMEMATGDVKPPRMFVGRILGWVVRPMVLKEEKPLGKNGPTAPSLVITGERNFAAERQRLSGLVDRFATGGPSACTMHPHTFFGRLTPDEWARLMYKHLDHHLQQFGV
jgi:uncharacterized protein DUF1569